MPSPAARSIRACSASPTSVDALTMLLLGGIQTVDGPARRRRRAAFPARPDHAADVALAPDAGPEHHRHGAALPARPRGHAPALAGGAGMTLLAVDGPAQILRRRRGGAGRDASRSSAARCWRIIGPNGAGKSTVFNMIGGQLRPDRGRVLLDGQDITHASPQKRFRRGVGRTFQVAQTFLSMTRRRERADGADQPPGGKAARSGRRPGSAIATRPWSCSPRSAWRRRRTCPARRSPMAT